MISNIEPLAGKAKPVPEPFHPACRIVSLESLERRCADLCDKGRFDAAAKLLHAVNRIQYAPDAPLPKP